MNYWYIDDVLVTATVLLDAAIYIDPPNLNCRSRLPAFTCYIELPIGYSPTDIDETTIRLNGVVQFNPGRPWYDNCDLYPPPSNGVIEMMVKFDRDLVEPLLTLGSTTTITITGALDDGTLFQGTDTIYYFCP